MESSFTKLSPDEIAVYRAAAQQRIRAQSAEIASLKKDAWVSAQRAADMLRDQFAATRVVVFGSLVHEGGFTRWSDIDIAAWGLSAGDTFRAMGAVMDLDEPFEINLVDVQTCSASLLKAIEQEGIDL